MTSIIRREVRKNRRRVIDHLREVSARRAQGRYGPCEEGVTTGCLIDIATALGFRFTSERSSNEPAVMCDLPEDAARMLDITTDGEFREPIQIYGHSSSHSSDGRFDSLYAIADYAVDIRGDAVPFTLKQIADVLEEQFRKGNLYGFEDGFDRP